MLELLRSDRYRRMPWKNGRGTTTEIARFPPAEAGSEAPFEWRVSVADVPESGPFSRFPGVDRTIVALDGAGMVLAHPERGTSVTLDPLEPYAFPGDLATECALRGGPLRDFNLMVRRGSWAGDLAVLRPRLGEIVRVPDGTVLVHVVRGCLRDAESDPGAVAGPFESWRLSGAGRATLAAAAADTVAIAAIVRRP